MTAKLLQGKNLAAEIQERIKSFSAGVQRENLPKPKLLAIQVTEDPSAKWYLGQQKKLAEKLGIEFDDHIKPGQVPDQETLLNLIRRANQDKTVQGVFITMPLPKGFDADAVLLALDPKKDVEGIHPANLGLIVLRRAHLIPPTAYAAFKLLESTGVSLRGKRAVLVGQSAIVGRPLQLLLGEKRVTTTVCNTGTPEEDVKEAVSRADIVIGCAGTPKMIQGAWIREGAIVIDVGTTEVDGQLVGDVEFEEAEKRAAFITPVPGGVGPLTVTMLMENLMHAYEWQRKQ